MVGNGGSAGVGRVGDGDGGTGGAIGRLAVAGSEVTAAPSGRLPEAVAVFRSEPPASMSACVTVYVLVHSVVSPASRVSAVNVIVEPAVVEAVHTVLTSEVAAMAGGEAHTADPATITTAAKPARNHRIGRARSGL